VLKFVISGFLDQLLVKEGQDGVRLIVNQKLGIETCHHVSSQPGIDLQK